jgi:hypothetical protein
LLKLVNPETPSEDVRPEDNYLINETSAEQKLADRNKIFNHSPVNTTESKEIADNNKITHQNTQMTSRDAMDQGSSRFLSDQKQLEKLTTKEAEKEAKQNED